MPDDTLVDDPSPEYLALMGSLDAYAMWAELSISERLPVILDSFPAEEWFGERALPVLGCYRTKPHGRWGQIKARFKAIGGNGFDLEKAVDGLIAAQREGEEGGESALPPQRPFTEPGYPVLPGSAYLSPSLANGAAPWLDAYVAHSQQFAPWGMALAHQAVGLWVLSTMAARRVYVPLGPSNVYPSLFIAMVAESTLYSKTTTAMIGVQLLERSGGTRFLAADQSTPQALLRSMSGVVPPSYHTGNEEVREHLQARLAFAAQRGWYFDEWGHLLSQIRRPDSAMAGFHGFLRILDDGKDSFSNETIQRGREDIPAPYLALLTASTENDVAPFMTPGSSWWRDGFWPRFAFITPLPWEHASLEAFPDCPHIPPASLITPLHTWHTSLGIPDITMAEQMETRTGKPTGVWQATIGPLPQHELRLSPQARTAYIAYFTTLRGMLDTGVVNRDLFASYARFHTKALRIALLLASFQGATQIDLTHWAYAQQVVERWRESLHTLVTRAADLGHQDADRTAEDRLVHLLGMTGRATVRDMQRHIKGMTSEKMLRMLTSMVKAGHLFEHKEGRKTWYALMPQGNTQDGEQNDDENDVPF